MRGEAGPTRQLLLSDSNADVVGWRPRRFGRDDGAWVGWLNQTLINDALVSHIQQYSMLETMRQAVREEIEAHRKAESSEN